MSLIINIDTALPQAAVSIAVDGKIVSSLQNEIQNEHASFLHTTIEQLLTENHYQTLQVDAIAVTSGPGSYTGLRVGMAAAKGLCYALQKPLITINTLEAMAFNIVLEKMDDTILICPMIDARRMEVFTAIYDTSLNEILAPQPFILTEDPSFFNQYNKTIVFTGNGITKWQDFVAPHANFKFNHQKSIEKALASLSFKKFVKQSFANLFYAEPEYFKNNFILPPKA